jgi:membrane fusion protein (multidrug efflux system)
LAQAQSGILSAQARLVESQGTLQQAQATTFQTQVNQRQYQAAQAAISQAQAALADAEAQLSYTVITSPTTGRVGRRTVEAGQRVQPGQQLLAVVDNEVWVIANFKETQLEHMRPGQPATVKVDAYPGEVFEGKVDSLAPAAGAQFALLPPDNATGNFTKVVQRIPVKIVFNRNQNRQSLLVPGMSALVSVTVK